MRKLEEIQSQKPKIVFPKNWIPPRGPKEREQKQPSVQVPMKVVRVAHFLFIFISSMRYATPTSISETALVRAEMRMVTKNTVAMMPLRTGADSPIVANTYGRLSKISPGPAPGVTPAEKTAVITAKPAIRANIRSNAAVPSPETRRFSFLLTYEEYTRMVPTPRERE